MTFSKITGKILEWLEMPDKILKIEKPTQVGVTTSLITTALEVGATVAVLEPTNKIIDDTVSKAVGLCKVNNLKLRFNNPTWDKISRNAVMCPAYKRDEVFGWDVKGDCKNCFVRSFDCKYQQVKNNNSDLLALTYHKFQSLYNGYDNFGLLDLIMSKDVIVLDEIATTITYANTFSLPIIKKELERLRKGRFTGAVHDKISRLQECVENIYRHISLPVLNPDPCIMEHKALDIKTVKELAKPIIDKVKDKDNFRKFLLSLTHDRLIITPKKDDIVVTPYQDTFMKSFLEMLETRGFDGKVFITGARMPDTKDFKNIKTVKMPDFNETEKMQLVVCDKANWNFTKKWSRERDKVKTVLETLVKKLEDPRIRILVITINKEIADDIKSWGIQRVDTEEYLYYTHYRSEDTQGVTLGRRVVVCVGMPWTPQESYKEYDFMYRESDGAFRDIEIADTLKNAVGRSKDPLGKERSIVFMLGCTLQDFKRYFPDKEEVVETYKRNTIHKLAHMYTVYWLGINERAKCRYEDLQELPLVTEMMDYAREANKRLGGTHGLMQINMFIKNTVGPNRTYRGKKFGSKEFEEYFKKYRYMFPKFWTLNRGKIWI